MTIMQKTKQKNTKGMPEIVCFFAFGKKLNEMTHMGRFHRPGSVWPNLIEQFDESHSLALDQSSCHKRFHGDVWTHA